MTIYQEAHKKIDQFPEETVYLFIQLMDRMDKDLKNSRLKSGNKKKFLETAGSIDIDKDAISHLREVSMV